MLSMDEQGFGSGPGNENWEQKGKEAAMLLRPASLPPRRAKASAGSPGLHVMWCEAGLGYLWFIRTARVYHHPIKSRGSGNGSCFLS